ncbi:thiol:disulfide interchange protein [Neptunitalea chrysea]|uniref:Thiol:disulfide interchange protein n=1 Tax=Neptunitalea chrysea TaxID=1647581 RepID=A0A9W6EWT2_9FLAO|nr:TlpA disulfide reductase family protein [Neptunitalea chrysea]GLB53573.1 thiol:disulfide interchange protein [Neptunitalea chrysea]
MKYLHYLMLCSLLFIGCSNKETKEITDGYHIEGSFITGNYSGYIFLNTPYTKDSILVKNNRFFFDGKTDFPIQGWLTTTNSTNLAWLYLENSNIEIKLTNPEALHVITVKGSESYIKKTRFENFINNHYNDANFYDAVKDSLTIFIKKNPNHSLSGKFLGQIASQSWILSAKEVANFKKQLDTTKQTGSDLFVINQAIKKLNTYGIGNQFKDFDIYNLDGKIVSTNTVNAPYLLVDFWASWCVPCRKQNPEWVKLYQEFHTKGFNILSISIEDGIDTWKKGIEKDHLEWNHLRSGEEFDSPLAQYYQLYSIPYNIVIDKNRKVIGVNVEPKQLKYLLEKSLH